MVKKLFKKLVGSKIIIFIIQFSLLSLLIFGFRYDFQIEFDSGITTERQQIIQFLANYLHFIDIFGLLFIGGVWIGISLIPIVIYQEPRSAATANLKIFFFLNFFFYVFSSRYTPIYFNAQLWDLLTKTLILGIIIIGISISLSYGIGKLTEPTEETHLENLREIAKSTISKCPNCGEKYYSKPKYCYKCMTKFEEPSEILENSMRNSF
ncbi:MAG: conserved membrane protein of unknown function [Promethearchaeota archaeon]|nr:MAG: conserved membrane protein of unknown function [Candidatus Lokiarchaeota archaeon]